jgi:hypothetical protein
MMLFRGGLFMIQNKIDILLVVALISFVIGCFWFFIGVGLKFLIPLGSGVLLLLVYFLGKAKTNKK